MKKCYQFREIQEINAKEETEVHKQFREENAAYTRDRGIAGEKEA